MKTETQNMSQWRIALYSLLLVCLVASCHDDDNSETTLITIEIPEDQLNLKDYAERGFVMISDDEGEIIAFKEYHNGETFSLKSSTFKQEKFFLTFISRLVQNGVKFYGNTYADVAPGKWVLQRNPSNTLITNVGTANLNFINPLPGTYEGVCSYQGIHYNAQGNTSSAGLREDPSYVYLARDNDGEHTYNLFSNIKAGDNTIDLSTVTKPLNELVVNVPEGVEFALTSLYGYPVKDDYSESYTLGNFHAGLQSSYKVLYPGNDAFPSYWLRSDMVMDNYNYERASSIENFSQDEIEHNKTIEFVDGHLQCAISGNFDIGSVGCGGTIPEGAHVSWNFWFAPGVKATVFPMLKFPDELKSLSIPNFQNPTSYGIEEFKELNGYDEYHQFIRSSSRGYLDLYDPGKEYTRIFRAID